MAEKIFELGYGAAVQCVSVPQENLLGVLEPNELGPCAKGSALVEAALRAPIGSPPLCELVRQGDKVVVITSDLTRPLPSREVLPPVLRELAGAGIPARDITVVFALGSHRPHTDAEKIKLVGEEIFNAYRCVDSDPADCIHFGHTAAGTPVDVTRAVAEADVRIGLANIEYHYFAGYSGGAKALMPGVSTRAAIQANHSKMVLPGAATGNLIGNPVRADLEEAIALCPLHFIVNVVLDEHKEILHAVAGHYIHAHREGCKFLDSIYSVPIPRRADIVIASQGGAPKDINLYQTQKALDNAKHAVKPGGTIILVGECAEGLGEAVFEQWMLSANEPHDLIERIQREFVLGGHKAAAIAMVLAECDVWLVSAMPPDFVRRLHLRPFGSVQQAFDIAMLKHGPQAEVLVMPYGGSTLPFVRQNLQNF